MTVVYYEGLLGIFHNALKNGIIKRAEEEYPTIIFEQRYWTDASDLPPGCLGVIGHSFGGWRALNMVHGRLLFCLTIDPRMMPWTKMRANFVPPRHVNFYQRGFMGGHYVEHAWNIEAKETHMGLASSVAAWRELDRLL